MEQAIKKALQSKGCLYKAFPDALLGQLEAIASQHGLEAKGIASAFDKFMTTSRAQTLEAVTIDDVEAFAEHYSRASRPQLHSDNLFARGPSWEDAALGGVLGAPPAGGSTQPSQRISPYLSKLSAQPASAARARPRTPASAGKFRERAQSGEVQAVLNPHVALPAEMDVDGGGGSLACEIEVLGAPLRADAKYMMNRIEDKVEHLERRITALEDAVEARGLDVHCVARVAQEAAIFVGRVCCDTEEGRLNPQSVLLEGSMRLSQGGRVRLDLSKCPAFRIFPGQVVAVRGTNPSGHCVVASEVIGGLPLPMPRTSLEQLAAYASASGKRGVSAVVAAGPFSASEDCEYEPLQALLDYCASAKPDLLLLLGPFVDAEHPAVKGGLLDKTFDDLYETRVLDTLAAFSSGGGSGTRVLLMPSVRDAHHHPVFPQPPMPAAQPVTNLPSPATVRCNEVVLGCTGADWLLACSSQEISRTAGQVDRLPALASHILLQRNYMPMFPPPASLPLDSTACAALELPCTPDVLVVPSDLQPFAKVVRFPGSSLPPQAAAAAGAGASEAGPSAMETDSGAAAGAAPQADEGSVVCINPGRLAKGASGGTFAHVYIPPLKEVLGVLAGEPAATNGAVPHRVDQRCRVEIRRI